MALTNIEYGSLASSATINNNFNYLDERITSSNSTINTNISSIMSNIATINASITTLSESISESISTINATIADYKNKVKLLVKNSGMVPNWAARKSITFTSGTSYTAESNGYVLALPAGSGKGTLTVNNVSVHIKNWDNAYDYAAELITIPVKSGDVLATSITMNYTYFIPSAEISVNDF